MLLRRKKLYILLLSVSIMLTSSACSIKCNLLGYKEDSSVSSSVLPSNSNNDISSSSGNETAKDVFVHFIDVGQGDSILIKAGSDNILIDGGERGTTVLDYLKENNVTKLDLVVGTHPHADHIGGLINVLENVFVKEVLDPGVIHTTKTFEDYLTVIDKKDIKFTVAKKGQNYTFANGMILKVLHPNKTSSKHLNDSSIVIQLVYDDVKFMLSGDAEKDSENEILDMNNSVKSNILKVGHHGSSTSTTKAFLDAVSPEVAIIMAGEKNKYGHPHKETINKLNSSGINTYITKLHGNIVIGTDGKTYSVNTNKPVTGDLVAQQIKSPREK